MRLATWFGLGLFGVLLACSSEQNASTTPSPAPSGTVEPGEDTKPVDPGDTDEDGGAPKDSGTTTDANVAPADILGTLSGSCGHVKLYLTSPTSSFIQNAIEFTAGETYDKASLSDDGDRLFDTPNAGGSSTESETMSFEILRACDGAKLLKTETEIGYTPPDDAGPSSISDILVEIGGKKIGVQVVRIYRPSNQTLTDDDAKDKLVEKFEGIKRSTVRVLPADKWVKQILHVFTANKAATDAVLRVLPTIDASVKANTIVVLTQSTGGGFLYCKPAPALGSECP